MMVFRTPGMEQMIGAIPGRTLSLLLEFPGRSGRVLDLGCGKGSFDYEAFPHARVVAVDRTVTDRVRLKYASGIVAQSRKLLLKAGSIDAWLLT